MSANTFGVLGRELYEDEAEAAVRVKKPLNDLAHEKQKRVLKGLKELKKRANDHEKTVKREVNDFTTHQEYLHYEKVEAAGCPKGSGAMESACAPFQTRFKRTGQL